VISVDRQGLLPDLANELWEAQETAQPVAPLTNRHPELDVADAYAIQRHNVERRVRDGRHVVGRKVGLTSKPMQQLLGVDEPDFGALLDDMFVEEGDEVALGTLIQPRVEAEMAFIMGRDLAGPGVTTTTALAAIAGVLPAIEIVDSRVADWRIKLVDTIADNASSAKVVIGGRLTRVTDVDLRLIGMLFHRNGIPIANAAGAAALGNPARCVAWLANKLGALGTSLRRDDVVLPGAMHRMVPVRPGDVFRAEFARLGAVSVRFGNGGGPE
jgi:2-oxopent-4-enoate hydratase